jgi:tetratricopeptide (TPR) repeat protein
MALFRTKPLLQAVLLAAALSLGLAVARAASQEQPPQLSDDTADVINKSLRPANDAKDWDKALSLIAGVLAKVAPDSYDAAIMNQIRAQVSFQKNDYASALGALERCLAIDDQKHFFEVKTTQEMLYQVSQLDYQMGASTKDLKQQAAYFQRADDSLQKWLARADAKSFTQDTYLFIATMYFSRGQTEPGAADQKAGHDKEGRALLEKALYWVDRGLRSAIKPRDNFYQLKLATLYQLDRFNDAVELLELGLKQKPDKKDYWQQLAATYLQLSTLAEEKKDSKAAFAYNVRVILTIERAQRLGYMSTPKENYNLVGIYFSIGQFERACELLEKGLETGGIEPTRANWELLAFSYQQIHKDLKAVATLEKAAKIFPKSGQVEYQIAQVYFGIDKEKESLEHMKRCIAKGGTEKPSVGWMFYAFLANDLREFDIALKAATEAAKYPDTARQAAQIIEAVNATIDNRENQRKKP